MMDKDLREEFEILNAARLMDTDAPVKLNTKRARRFVSATIEGEGDEKLSFLGALTNLFKRPTVMFGGVTAVAFACAAVVMAVLPQRESDMYSVQPQIQSVHASLDSLSCESDSLSVNMEDVEIITVE